ncbi:hypothetical protein HAX54_053315 [Datura stramonium]|uniref:Uncharacterized protein n=1 Tax=Datura stramonium TaxID=4076 RepID=A0ABS8T066_DATST|nr:hypothetical protein [Datura stramonium]
MASLIAAGTPSWATNAGTIFKSDLNIRAKKCLGFVCSRLTPSKTENQIPSPRVISDRLHHEVAKVLVPHTRDDIATETSTPTLAEALPSSSAALMVPQPMQLLSQSR